MGQVWVSECFGDQFGVLGLGFRGLGFSGFGGFRVLRLEAPVFLGHNPLGFLAFSVLRFFFWSGAIVSSLGYLLSGVYNPTPVGPPGLGR